MAAAYMVLGPSEFATTLPNILYAAGLVALTYFFGRKYFGEAEAFLSAAFVAVSAFLVARPMEIGVYGPEILFSAAACWLFLEARRDDKQRFALLAAVGLFCGFAWSMREQTAALGVGFGILLLLERKRLFPSLVALGAGFGAVLIAELIGYYLAAGDPFYRYGVDLQHRTTGWDAVVEERPPFLQKYVRPFKDAIDDPITTPLLFLAIGVAAWFRVKLVRGSDARRDVFLVFGVISVVTAIIAAYAFDFAKPRYFPVLHYTAVMLLAFACAMIARSRGMGLASAFAALVVFLNVAGEDFSNYNEYAEARRLAEIALTADEKIFTDPLTASRARHYLRLFGATEAETSAKIRHEDVPAGSLFYKAYSSGPRPHGVACTVSREAGVRPYSWTHAFIRWTNADDVLGAKIKEIVWKPRPVELVRVLAEPSESDPVSGRACLPAE
jgi:hypothetical protein